MTVREIEGHVVLLVNVVGGIQAFVDCCPHLGTRLSKGSLQRNVLTCATHGWEFDVSTGLGINPRKACLESFAVKVENGDILIDVGARELKE
jgi:toluene monooxygenase system ferredoxin subunit